MELEGDTSVLLGVKGRVVESELGVGGVACFQLESGVGVVFSKLLESESSFQKCWSRSRESVLKKWRVGVDFLNLNNLWDGVGVGILKIFRLHNPG